MFLLGVLGVIAGVGFVLIALIVEYGDPEDDLPFRSKQTVCPNCGHAVPSLPFGRHRCGKCDFVYDVNKWSYAKKYSDRKRARIRKFSNICYIISIVSFIMIFAPKPTFLIAFELGTYDFVVYFVVFLITGTILHNNADKVREGRAFYDKQLNDES
ncbi:MAG: hypothetical protein AAFQ94_25955 [Bacteroidota bacterium]